MRMPLVAGEAAARFSLDRTWPDPGPTREATREERADDFAAHVAEMLPEYEVTLDEVVAAPENQEQTLAAQRQAYPPPIRTSGQSRKSLLLSQFGFIWEIPVNEADCLSA
jgi:hypothetical protein